MLDHNTHFSYSSYLVQDENQKIIGKINAPQIISYQKILRNNYVGCLTAIYDSQSLANYLCLILVSAKTGYCGFIF